MKVRGVRTHGAGRLSSNTPVLRAAFLSPTKAHIGAQVSGHDPEEAWTSVCPAVGGPSGDQRAGEVASTTSYLAHWASSQAQLSTLELDSHIQLSLVGTRMPPDTVLNNPAGHTARHAQALPRELEHQGNQEKPACLLAQRD